MLANTKTEALDINSDNKVHKQFSEKLSNSELKKELKKALKKGGIVALSRIINAGGNVVIVFFLSHLDIKVLAASGLTSATQTLFVSTSAAMVGATSIQASRLFGEKKFGEINDVLWTGAAFSGLVSLTSGGLVLASPYLFKVLGIQDGIVVFTEEYFRSFAGAIPAIIFLSCQQKIAYSTDNDLSVLMLNLFKTTLTVGVSYPLIFGSGFIPKLGFAGAGYAELIANWTALGLFSGYLRLAPACKKFKFCQFSLEKRELWRSKFGSLLQSGLVIGIQVGNEVLSLEILTLIISKMGKQVLASHQIANQFTILLLIPTYAIAQSATITIGKASGSNQAAVFKKAGLWLLLGGATVTGGCAIAFLFFSKEIVSPFLEHTDSKNHQTLVLAANLLKITGGIQVMDAIRNINVGLVRGFNDVDYAMYISLLTNLLIAIPLAYGLGGYTSLGVYGVYLARAISIGIGAFCMSYRWHSVSNMATRNLDGVKEKFKNSQIVTKVSGMFSFFYCKKTNKIDETSPLIHETNQVSNGSINLGKK